MTVPISVYFKDQLSCSLPSYWSEVAHMLSLVLVVDTRDLVTVLNDLLDICLLEDLDSIRRVLGKVLELIVSLDFCRPLG
jgi:hypothetical protein